MRSLIRFFQELRGEHLPKTDEQVLCFEAGFLVDGIDCCDVVDICCDSYE